MQTRSTWITPYCGALPEQCLTDGVNPFDRPAIYNDSGGHDILSFASQYAAGAVGLLIPLILIFRRKALNRNEKLFHHFLRFIQITVWNGFFFYH